MQILFLLALIAVAPEHSDVDRLTAAADAVLQRDTIHARADVGVVFQLADRLADAGKEKDAVHYYEGGLRIEPHDFEHHVRYAEALLKLNETALANEQVKIVLEGCEDPDLVLKAQDTIGARDVEAPPLEKLSIVQPVIVLVPLGNVDMLLLQQEQQKLHEDLGIEVELRSVPFDMPDYSRYAMGTETEKQWDAENLLQKFTNAVGPLAQNNVRYLGITDHDIFGPQTNFVFGWSGDGYGIVSYRRFMATFNGEIPQRSRLLRRFHFQCLASSGHVFALPRCTDPSCPLSYPQSLAEHDAKSDKICDICRAGFKSAFADYDTRRGFLLFVLAIISLPAIIFLAILVHVKAGTMELMLISVGFLSLIYSSMANANDAEQLGIRGMSLQIARGTSAFGISFVLVGGYMLFTRMRAARLLKERQASMQA